METKFGFGKAVDLGFDEAIETVTEELGKEGFGVLTEIDVQATLKKKLDVEFENYVILGACNPQLAHEAVSDAPEIGLLLPCNVIIFEDEKGNIVVSFAKPKEIFSRVARSR